MVNSSKNNRHISVYEIILNACLLVTITAILITHPSAINAKVYKWVDDQGVVHYGSEKPEDAEAERVKIKQQPIFGGEDGKPVKDKDNKDKKEEDKKPAKVEERLEGDAVISKKEKAKLCKQAKDRLQSIQNSGRLRAYDEKGESRLLSDKERNKRLAEAKDQVKEYCGR